MADSRIEALLENWAGADNEILPPISNNERILQNILGIEGVDIEPIQSRVEALLLQILEQGGGSGGDGTLSTVEVTFTLIGTTAVNINGIILLDYDVGQETEEHTIVSAAMLNEYTTPMTVKMVTYYGVTNSMITDVETGEDIPVDRITVTGNIVLDEWGVITITGSGTVTIDTTV